MMPETPQTTFCSTLFAHTYESLYATAPVIDRLLLLEYNRPWSSEPFEKNDLPEAVRVYLEDCEQKGIFSRMLFIRKSRSRGDQLCFFTVNNRDIRPFVRRFEMSDYKDLPSLDMESCFGESTELFDGELYLVCTNGKVDRCCAKFGLPVYEELSKRSDDVWQCSHITGCRFAPGVVSVPYLHYYGHLSTSNLSEMNDCLKSRQIFRSNYRGRACYPPEVQAAEYFLRNELDDFQYDAFELISNDISGEIADIVFDHKPSSMMYQVKVQLRTSREEYQMNCKGKMMPVKEFKPLVIKSVYKKCQ